MKRLWNYSVEISILLMHLITPFGSLGVIIGSLYIFYLVAFKNRIDLVSLFILLLPAIALQAGDEIFGQAINQYGEKGWIKISIPSLTSVFPIGPVSVSTRFFAALAVPVRLVRHFHSIDRKGFAFLWLISLFISVVGLYMAIIEGHNSAGGLTVGLRIVLAVGAILFPLFIDKEDLKGQINIIIKISLALFILGLLNGQWLWITATFAPFLIFSNEKTIWKLIGFLTMCILLLYGFTFSIKFIVITSFLLLLSFNRITLSSFIVSSPLKRTVLFLLPIIIMLFIITNPKSVDSELSTTKDRFNFKLYEDRGSIWKNSVELIINSNFFIVPAARDIIQYNRWGNTKTMLGIGAHNIYLEMGRHLGLFVTIVLTIIMGYYFTRSLAKATEDDFFLKFMLSFLAIYIVFGLAGNSLIYDGVGFLFWIIIGQIYQSNSLVCRNENL